jgi:cholesterol transport system auxiliary component
VGTVKSFVAIGTVLLLAGCGTALTGSKPAALDTVTLSGGSTANSARKSRIQILIAEPKALKIYDSQNIVIATSATGLEYLGGSQWADRLPSLVQVKLAETLQNAGYTAVGLPGQGLAIDYQLISEIRDFSVRIDGGDRANVSIFVKLLNDRNGDVVASRAFEGSAPASSGNYPAALDAAFTEVSANIVAWVGKGVR